MNIRRILLRVMLISLAIAAVVGAGSVMMLPTAAVWRVVGMLLITAATTGLLLPITLLIDRPKARAAGLFSAAALLLEYVLVLMFVWDVPGTLGVDSGPLIATALLLPAVAIPTAIFFRMATTQVARVAGHAGVVLAGAEFILLMVAVWTERFFGSHARLYAIGGVGAIFLPIIIASLVGHRWWRWVGVAIAAVAMVVSGVAIWTDAQSGAGWFTFLTTAACLIAYTNLAVQIVLRPGQNWLRITTLIMACWTAICIDAAVIIDERAVSELFGRLAAATGILGGFGTLALLILAALNRKIEHPPVAINSIKELTLVCPMCQKKQLMQTGGAACSGCGLKISIRLEEPHCANCGYLLFGLKSDKCPECGTPCGVPAAAMVAG